MIDENGEWHRRLFIFDLDGTLVDSKEIHFNALNEALKEIDSKYVISKEDQEKMFEGLPTKQKLNILSEYKGLPLELHDKISKLKQEKTIDFFKNLDKDEDLIELFKIIKENHVDIAVASNCIRKTIEVALTSLGLMDYVDVYLGNEDVSEPKPHPEIFNKCMNLLGNGHPYTTIFEDSLVGKTAALKSRCRLVSVKNRSSLTVELIESELFKTKKKVNVLIPMAGEGSRFSLKGFKKPKPLIDIDGKSMINLVHDNIGLEDAHYIFVAKKEHIDKYKLKEHIQSFCKDFTLISQEGRLEGAAMSCLLAKDLIDNDSPLLIANSDQYVLWDSKSVIKSLISSGVDGSILTFISDENKWSYVKNNIYGMVEKVAEKEVISNAASCGIYYWKSGSDFVKYSESMIKKNIKTNNEFYVCPVYNEAILNEAIINTVPVKKMAGLGTPEDLKKYLKMLLDIKNGYGVEEVSVMTDSEICVKYKNPSFKFYEGHERALGLFHRWDKNARVFSIPEEIDLLSLNGKHMVNPIIHGIHNSLNKSFDGRSVYPIAYCARFFHFMLEHLPKILFLKEKDPNFKLLLFADEKKNENGIFLGLNGEPEYKEREGDGSTFKFWLDILKIDYECFNVEDLAWFNFNFDSAYVFYENTFLVEDGQVDMYDRVILNGSPIYYDKKEYHPSITLDRGKLSSDIDTINWSRPYIIKELDSRVVVSDNNKKTYISRRNYLRSHPNDIEIEDYFVSQGYTPVFMEDLNPLEQLKIIRESSDVVCYLGSSLVNLYYAKPETNVTILTLKDPRSPKFVSQMTHYYSKILESNKINISVIDLPDSIEGNVSGFMKFMMEKNNGI
jgi:beta-phosphoglucomutase-like phosphatase (HAD superfamily)/NDP-sugar pyrophosphorylase family protein